MRGVTNWRFRAPSTATCCRPEDVYLEWDEAENLDDLDLDLEMEQQYEDEVHRNVLSLGQRISTDAMQLHGSSQFQPLSAEELDLIEMIVTCCHIKVYQKKPLT